MRLRVRASAKMNERKRNLTSCWIERSKIKLGSRDCAISIAYGSAKLTGFSNDMLSNPLRTTRFCFILGIQMLPVTKRPWKVRIPTLIAFIWTRGGQRQQDLGALARSHRVVSLLAMQWSRTLYVFTLSAPRVIFVPISNFPCSCGSLSLFRHKLASEMNGKSVAAIEASSTARSPWEAHLRYEAHLLTPLRQVTHIQIDAMVAAAIAPCAAQVAGVRQSVVARKSFSGVAGQDFCSPAF